VYRRKEKKIGAEGTFLTKVNTEKSPGKLAGCFDNYFARI